LGTVSPYFYSHNGEIWHEGAELGLPPPSQILFKKSLKGVYPFWGNLYQKLQMSAIFAAVCPRFTSENGEIWRECTDPGTPPLIL